jgi:hypothetical protein
LFHDDVLDLFRLRSGRLMAATASRLRWRWLVVPGGFTNHPLNIAETAGTLRVGVFAIIQTLGAFGFDVVCGAGNAGGSDFALNFSHHVLEAITNQAFRLRALLENWHTHSRVNDYIARNRIKIRHVALRRRAEAEAIQRPPP